MKTRIMIKNLGLGLITVFLMMLSVNGYSQACPGNQLTLSIQNVTNPTPTTVEYDVFITNTGTTAIKVSGFAGNVRYPAAGWATAATLTVVDQPASNAFPGISNVAPSHVPATQQLRWTNTPFAPVATSVNVPAGMPMKFVRYRLTNPTPWPDNTPGSLYFANGGAGISLNTVTVYCNTNTNSTPITLATSTLQLAHTSTVNPVNFTINEVIGGVCFTSGTASVTGPLCNGGTGSAVITMSPTPTSSTISYTVDGGASTPGTLNASNEFTVSGLSAGAHSVVVTGDVGCATPVTVNFTVNEPTAVVASGSAGTILCNGGTTSVTVSATGGTPPYTGEGTFTVSAGAYSFTVTDANGCTSTASGNVSEPTALVASGSAGTILCNGGSTSVVVSATGGTAPYTGTGTFTVSAGAYSFTVTDANGCTSTASGTVSEPAALVASGSAGTILCNGGSTSVVVSATGGTAPYTGTGTFTVSAGAYSFTVTDANGCTSTTSGVVSEPTAVVASGSVGAAILCNGGTTTVTVSATGGTAPYTGTGTFTVSAGAYSFTVTDANGCTSTASGNVSEPTAVVASGSAGTILCNGGSTSVVVSATGGTPPYTGEGTFTVSAGPYSFTVTDANGCTSTASGNVSEPTALVASGSAGTILCNGGSTSVVVSATGGTAPYTGTGTFTVSAGAYSFTVTDANGCTSTASGTVSEPAALVASGSAGTILCNGGSTSVVVSATGGTAPYTGTGTFTVSAGAYSFTVTDANGCTSTTSGVVSEPTAVVASGSVGAPIVCFGGTTTVTVSATGGTPPYTGEGTFTVSAGAYSFTVTDANGCTSTATGTVSQPSAVVAVGSIDAPIVCFGGSTTVTVSATGGTAPYTGTGTFTVSAGAYSFTVTDANGCTSTVSGTVTQPAQLTTTTTITQSTPYTWAVSGLTYSVSGTYVFNTVNGSGCTVINTLNLTIATGPVTVINATQCGSTLPTINTQIVANNVSAANRYRFEVTDTVTNLVQVTEAPLRIFYLTNLGNYTFARTYSVRVAVRIGTVWQAFGAACNVTTPSPTTQIQASQCNTTLTTMGDVIYANAVPFAAGYQFRIVNTSTSAITIVDRTLRDIRLNLIAGFTPQPGTTYAIDVAVKNTNGTYLSFGTVCNITTPGGSGKITTDSTVAFQATAYPNPFAENFMIDVKTSSQELIGLRVYDMLGKLIEDRNVDVSSITDLEVGARYPSGVYNVIVTQGDVVKTLRVVKR